MLSAGAVYANILTQTHAVPRRLLASSAEASASYARVIWHVNDLPELHIVGTFLVAEYPSVLHCAHRLGVIGHQVVVYPQVYRALPCARPATDDVARPVQLYYCSHTIALRFKMPSYPHGPLGEAKCVKLAKTSHRCGVGKVSEVMHILVV